jgi:uncharacterized membrane protein
MFRYLKGNRTRLFGILLMILGVVEQYAREVVPQDKQGLVLMVIGIVVIILRQITTTPPGVSVERSDPMADVQDAR